MVFFYDSQLTWAWPRRPAGGRSGRGRFGWPRPRGCFAGTHGIQSSPCDWQSARCEPSKGERIRGDWLRDGSLLHGGYVVDRKLSFFRPHLDNLVFAVFPDDDALPVHSAGFVWSWLKRKRERYFQCVWCMISVAWRMAWWPQLIHGF